MATDAPTAIGDRQRLAELAVRAELRRHRIGLGSRELVAPQLGVSAYQLGAWERGDARAPAWVLLALRDLARVAA